MATDRNKFTWYSLTIFLISMITFLITQNIAKPRVLILHSYNLDFSWPRDINVGINRIFDKQAYKLRWHYMDTKRHPDKEFKERAGNTAREMIDDWRPHIIIAVDDNAQEYVAKYYIDKPNINIIFTGVNKTLADYGYDKAKNATGILERINYQAVKDTLLQILPKDKHHIKHISDNSPTSQGIHKEMEAFNWEPLEFLESVQTKDYASWKKAIKEANNDSDFLLLTHYHTILKTPNSKEIVAPKQVMNWTMKNSNLPGVSFWGFYVEDGGMLAIALSPYEQGEIAAKMAVKVLNNIPTKNIPVETSRLFLMYMRGSLLKEKLGDLNMPLVFEAFSRATNNYYE